MPQYFIHVLWYSTQCIFCVYISFFLYIFLHIGTPRRVWHNINWMNAESLGFWSQHSYTQLWHLTNACWRESNRIRLNWIEWNRSESEDFQQQDWRAASLSLVWTLIILPKSRDGRAQHKRLPLSHLSKLKTLTPLLPCWFFSFLQRIGSNTV